MKKYIGLLICCIMSASANATLLTGEVADDAFVTLSGYDLAWATPCSDGLLENSCGAIDLSEQSGYGWKIMTSDLFASLNISASTFIVDYTSSNTQSSNGINYAKASGWFSNLHSHIDIGDGLSGRWSFSDTVENCCNETIAYRTSVSVPEPTSVALFGLCLVGLGLARKKKTV